MGLRRTIVLEGIKRVGELWAKTNLVDSMQQFCYNIVLFPYKQQPYVGKTNQDYANLNKIIYY